VAELNRQHRDSAPDDRPECVRYAASVIISEPAPWPIMLLKISAAMRAGVSAIAIVTSHIAFSQGMTDPSFEVASVKPSWSVTGNSSVHYPKGRIVMENVTLQQCIEMAYDVRDDSLFGPAWLGSARFDIEAKLPSSALKDDTRPMLRGLLADRFKLRVHRESRVRPGYALVAAKKGPKLEAAADPHGLLGTSAGRGRLAARSITMAQFAEMLSRQLERPVQDRTDLPGVFDLKLEWKPDEPAPAVSATIGDQQAVVDVLGPSLYSAIEEQLGLRLTAGKIPVDVLVGEHVERTPTEN
jgi:uncharacterized protein (TIGR03435 family)